MSDKRLLEYKEQHFGLTRTSPHSASVQLICGRHEHEEFLVELIEECSRSWVARRAQESDCDWAVGRETQGYPIEGTVADAMERAADLLLEECSAMKGIEDYFGEDGNLSTTQKVQESEGRQYLVTKMSTVAARVDAICDGHSHRFYIIGLVEDEAAGWIVGRTDADSPKYSLGGQFTVAVEQAANLLWRECLSMAELDTFFDEP